MTVATAILSALQGLGSKWEGMSSDFRVTPSFGQPEAPGTAPHVGAFQRIVEEFLSSAAKDRERVDQAVQDIAVGRSNDFHTVALASTKADLHFRLIMEIRNRVLDAYQEVMRMQV